MKKISIFSLVVILLVVMSVTVKANEPQTHSGSKAMFISLTSLTDLSFDDTYFGGMYLFADRQGITTEIGFLSETNEIGGADVKVSSLYLSVGYINYVFQNGPVAFYLNPYIGISSSANDGSHVETSGIDIGVGIGSEWWAFENVSLAANVLLGYSSTTTEQTVLNIESKSSSFGILGGGSGRFYLTFYF